MKHKCEGFLRSRIMRRGGTSGISDLVYRIAIFVVKLRTSLFVDTASLMRCNAFVNKRLLVLQSCISICKASIQNAKERHFLILFNSISNNTKIPAPLSNKYFSCRPLLL